jgi:hypothetical protein
MALIEARVVVKADPATTQINAQPLDPTEVFFSQRDAHVPPPSKSNDDEGEN